MLALRPDGAVAAASQPCPAPPAAAATAQPLGNSPLRVASWNLHKGVDAGWQADLARCAAEHDLLLQEAVLTDELRRVIEGAGHQWRMAGAFAWGGVERGVMIAARSETLSVCTLHSFEPMTPLPKSAMVAHYRLGSVAGAEQVLAVANLHGINFTLGLTRFTEQIEAVAQELARHRGPVILGGDFNTWSEARHEVMLGIAERLALTPVERQLDGRRRTLRPPSGR